MSARAVTCAASWCWWSALLHAGPGDARGEDDDGTVRDGESPEPGGSYDVTPLDPSGQR